VIQITFLLKLRLNRAIHGRTASGQLNNCTIALKVPAIFCIPRRVSQNNSSDEVDNVKAIVKDVTGYNSVITTSKFHDSSF
jgi:hypothetical protein